MRLYFDEIGLKHIIDVYIPEASSMTRIKWGKDNKKVVSKIADFLDNSHMAYIKDNNPVAKRIFKDLDAVYDRKSKSAGMAIRRKLVNFKLTGDVLFKDHFRSLMS